jgi:hypothetical protein
MATIRGDLRGAFVPALLAVLLSAGRSAAEDDILWLEPRQADGMTAQLGVRIADSAAALPVTLFVVVEGPATLQTEPAHLSESVAAWEARTSERWYRPPHWENTGTGRKHTEIIRLSPTRSGPQSLPSVAVRFRSGPNAEWQRVEWTEPLKEIRSGPSPDIPPTSPTPGRPWWFTLYLTAGALGLAGLVLVLITLRRRPVPTLAERTLSELSRLDPAAPEFHVELARCLRRFIGENEGLPARERTTAELLESLNGRPGWTPERLEQLDELLRHCDLALYAAAAIPQEERRTDLERAQLLVSGTPTPAK